MSIEIIAVRYGSTSKTESTIVRYKWRSDQDGSIGDNDKPSLVAWVDEGGQAYVSTGSNRVNVGVWCPDSGQPWLQTYADNTWTNNLQSLPEF